MANTKTRSMRPVSALFQSHQPAGVEDLADAKMIAVELIDPNPYQPRQRSDESADAELAASIGRHGILQPLLVRPIGERFQLVAGERRWRAAQVAGLATVPVIEREMGEDELEVLALLENIQRQNLDPVDEAQAYRRLMERVGLSQRALAEQLNTSHTHIQDRLLLLKDATVAEAVRAGDLGATAAQKLVRKSPEERARTLDEARQGKRPRVKDVAPPVAIEAAEVANNLPASAPMDGPAGAKVAPGVANYLPRPTDVAARRSHGRTDLIGEDALQVVKVLRAGQGRAQRTELIAALRQDLAQLEQA